MNRPANNRPAGTKLGGYRGRVCTYEEIADILGITRQRVAQIERTALKKLRDGLDTRGYGPEEFADYLLTIQQPAYYNLLIPEREASDD